MRLLATAVLLLAPALVAAHPDVEAGRQLFLKGEFRASLARLEDAQRSPSTTEDDLVDIHWLRGADYSALGKRDQADKAFDALLELRPLFTPPRMETNPEVRAAFKKRSDHYFKKRGITVGEPTVDRENLAVMLDGNVREAASVAVFARSPGEVQYTAYTLAVEDKRASGRLADAGLWERVAREGKLEVVIEVRNGRGTPVARGGDAQAPLVLAVSAEQAQAALAAVKPAEPPPTTGGETAAATGGTSEPATGGGTGPGGAQGKGATEEGSGPGMAGRALLAVGGGLLVAAGLPLLVGVAGAATSAGSLGLLGYTYQQLVTPGSDLQRSALEQRWWASVAGAGVGGAVGGVSLLVALGAAVLGAVVLAAAFVSG